MTKYIFGFLFIFFLNEVQIFAQETSKDRKWMPALELYTGFSHNGVETGLVVDLQKEKNEFYAGIQLQLSDAYTIDSTPLGLILGYRRLIASNKNWISLVNVEYQWSTYNIDDLNSHEFYLAYILKYQLTPKIYIGNSIGIGGYQDAYLNSITNEKGNLTGVSSLLRIFVQYQLVD